MATSLRPAPADLPPTLREVIEYRKSGLSLNHVVGCPLDCGYCVRHLFDNYDMKRPHLVVNDATAVERLVGHWAFRPHITPIQIFNRATDPFLPGVKPHLFNVLEALDRRGHTNHVLVITRWRVLPADIARLEQLQNLKLTVLITWSGIDDPRIEPVRSAHAEASLRALAAHARRTQTILYWRPLIAGINDSDEHLARARKLAPLADATVFTGLFHRSEIRDHFRASGVPDLYDEIPRRKVLPRVLEERVLDAFEGVPLFRKTSCGVAYAHGVPDFNGHYGLPDICDICPAKQVAVCAAAHRTPTRESVAELATIAHLDPEDFTIDARRIEVGDSQEQQRYFIQHALNYQVHDRSHPHLPRRHGRAEVGWD
jgi:DNA repair photolyase